MKTWILKKLLTPEQFAILRAFVEPDRYQPDPVITPQEAAQWCSTLKSSLGLKIDQTMINMAQMHTQLAVLNVTATPELQRAAGFAAGFRAAWQTAKSLSVMFATKAEQTSENDATTGAPLLDHLSP